MKRFFISSLLLGLIVIPVSALAASPVKLKYVGTIYTDAAGIALQHPAGVTINGQLLLVADSSGKRVLTYSYMDGVVKPKQVFPLPDIFPLMVQQANNADLYVLDGRSRQIYLLDAEGKMKGRFTPKGMPDNKRMVPRSIKLAVDESLLVLDIFSERVLVFDADGTFQRQIAFPEQYGAIADLAGNSQGTIYLLDSVAAVVYAADKSAAGFTALTEGMKENMNFPTSLAADSHGRLFLLDKYGSGLAIVGADGSFVGRKLGMGWNDSQLYYPSQLSLNNNGNLFIADTENNRIQQFSISE